MTLVKAYAVTHEGLLLALNHQKRIIESRVDIVKTDIDPLTLFAPHPTSRTEDTPDPIYDECRIKFNALNKSIRTIGGYYGCNEHDNRNVLLYSAPSTMSWHTNSDHGGRRVYLTYTYGQSVFRYLEGGKVYDSYDEPFTWMAREFYLPEDKNNLLWHTIATNSSRISIGYEIKS